MAGPPDLFVICKNCGSEVSPYITECPYCGKRLQKRAPKIERDASGESIPHLKRRQLKAAAPPSPPKPRREPRQLRGLSGDEDARPVVTMALVVLGMFGFVVLAFADRSEIGLFGPPGNQLWRIFTSPFVNVGTWGQFASLLALAIFGVLLERRHGHVLVGVLWALSAWGGAALVAAVDDFPVAFGSNAGALAFLAAWVVPVLLRRRREPGEDDDADLLGVLAIGVVVALLPFATPVIPELRGIFEYPGPSLLAGAWGALSGAVAGLVLARLNPR